MLKVYCDKCQGTGEIYDTEITETGEFHKEVHGKCEKCKGLGYYFVSDKRDKANTFFGSKEGYVPFDKEGNKLDFDINFNQRIINEYQKWLKKKAIANLEEYGIKEQEAENEVNCLVDEEVKKIANDMETAKDYAHDIAMTLSMEGNEYYEKLYKKW